MYTLAGVHWAFCIRYLRTGRHEASDFDSSYSKPSWGATISPIQMNPAEGTDPFKDHIQPCFTAQNGALSAMVFINMLVNDTIVIWRAHILWPHNRRYRIISCLLIFAMGLSFAFSMLSIIYTQAGRNPLQRHNSNNSLSVDLSFGISWLSNVWATRLTRLKTLEHYDEVQRVIPVCHYHTPTEKVLGLFLRSGLTFTFLWTLLLLVTILDHMVPTNNIRVHRIIDVIIFAAPIQIAGMYPTILTILVAKTESFAGRALDYSDIPTPLLSPVDEAPSTGRLPLPESFEDEDHEGDSVTLLLLHPGSSA
ncbi:hypothetical protein PHLGIDRAFT_179918 [Phlebiopsis gigantea 11061_1 CR5-6]|uniref:G-protein coupled receptors family 1 profile domain-containing protein n=1 Tax=Phlebiopsis gigantea (strain 11061_1 CR5-6) TaxID=745531 RepID=A0A0C3RUS8_PHLG1|nr:hypothetical protein PHLGIDRAFT_179918 [Phlebiopsis gigantea 11061_1 CR5-6]